MDTARNFSSEVVCEACDLLRRRPQPFPPSAGELYDTCTDVARRDRERAEYERTKHLVPAPRLPPPKRSVWSDADLANWSLVINAPGRPYVPRMKGEAYLTIPPEYPGGGNPAFYGYLTPREIAEAKQAQRKAPARA